VKDIVHEQNHWFKLGRIGLYHKHYKGSTYNVLIEWYNGETTNDAFDENVADDPETRTEFSMYQALHITTGWIHVSILWFKGWYKWFSNLKRVIGIMQSKAEADTWIHGYKGSDPALYCVCGG
jgi:hypothetical protein